ncbi:MAG: hypothetical protein AAFY98_06935 [Verrucomicrobiota bacterium]
MIIEWIKKLFSTFGSRQYDQRTGEMIGKGLAISWGGTIHFFGHLSQAVRPFVLPANQTGYFHHRIGWESWPLPDVESISRKEDPGKGPVLVVLLLHQDADTCRKILGRWKFVDAQGHQRLVVYGGPKPLEDNELDGVPVLFCDDPRLRTKIHTMEAQSYCAVMQCACKWAEDQDIAFSHMTLFEWDHLPLSENILEQYLDVALQEDADLLAPKLERVDETLHGNWRIHLAEARKDKWPQHQSRRSGDSCVLTMISTGSFWSLECARAVLEVEEPFPLFQEIALPTQAHHLGFRARPLPASIAEWIHYEPLPIHLVTEARREGAPSIHPVKDIDFNHIV